MHRQIEAKLRRRLCPRKVRIVHWGILTRTYPNPGRIRSSIGQGLQARRSSTRFAEMPRGSTARITLVEASVRHHVALSVVGADRLPDRGYLRAELAQERLIKTSGIP
jgi:hypothetical protein